MTQVILIEDVYKLGRTGEVVDVKPGYARNYLIPQKKALRATADNVASFEARKAELLKRAADNRQDAEAVAKSLGGKTFVIIEQASEKGMLYGAVTAVSASKLLADNGFAVAKDAVQISKPIKNTGLYTVDVVLHADVTCSITLNIAVSQEVAEKQVSEAQAESSSEEAAA